MEKYIYFLVLILLSASILMLFTSCNAADQICLDKNTSCFSDFEVKGDKVFIKCRITLINKFDVEKSITLSAQLPEDVTIGLLQSSEIKALNEDGSERVFVLAPNEATSFEVVFIGEYAGTNQKYDRNLPEINIKIIK